MIPKNLKKSIEKLIAEGKTQEAMIKLSRSRVIKSDPQLSHLFHLISSQWQQYRKDNIQMTNSEDHQFRVHNKIKTSILELVSGDLKTSKSSHTPTPTPISENNSHGAGLKYFIGGLVFLLLILGGIQVFNSFFEEPPRTITNPVTKTILREYKVHPLNNLGQSIDMYIVKVYRDFSGEILIQKKSYPLEKVYDAGEVSLDFAYLLNGTSYRYKYLLPKLEDVQPGFNQINGLIYINQQQVGKWFGQVLK